jgi:polar amino acid transport system substrate-binding protein
MTQSGHCPLPPLLLNLVGLRVLSLGGRQMKMNLRHALVLVLIALTVGAGSAFAQQTTDSRVVDLVKSGKLRVGLFPPQYIKEPTGELKSAWVETARALATRIGVELVLLERPTPPKVVECLKGGECDVVFLQFDERAANVGDFSSPFVQFEYTLLVPAGSPIQTFPDADRVGARIAVVRNHASTLTLSPILKHAELVYAETPDLTFDLLRTGHADVMASTRNHLLEISDKLPNSRVLEDRYGVNLNRIVVPKGRTEWLSYVNDFVEEAKASGLMQKAIDRAGPRGVTVAPAGNSH